MSIQSPETSGLEGASFPNMNSTCMTFYLDPKEVRFISRLFQKGYQLEKVKQPTISRVHKEFALNVVAKVSAV